MSKPEIRGWFVPRVIPYGGAPEEIKEQWVDVPLPLRYELTEGPRLSVGQDVGEGSISILADSVSVDSLDALKALRVFERNEAADWWEGYFAGRAASLGFAVENGDQIYPTGLLGHILPGIENFDQIEP